MSPTTVGLTNLVNNHFFIPFGFISLISSKAISYVTLQGLDNVASGGSVLTLNQAGIDSFDAAKKFFRPQLEHLHDPWLMKDMDKAVARIEKAVTNNDSILVSWHEIPSVLFDSDTTGGCYPIQVYFYNNTDVSQVTSCEWDMGNGLYSNNVDTVVTVYANPGSFSVTLEVTNSNGCKNDTTFFNYIDIYDYPVAGFTSHPNPASILTPTVQFVDTSSQDVVLFDWTFYDSTNTIIGSDYEQNPIYNFSGIVEQQYYIQLYVENQNGCSDTVSGTQIVEGEYALFLPNSFTPNGDGMNDNFYPVGDKISVENYSFKIFNRWGEMVFNTTDFGASWDGEYKGSQVASDAYIWKIDLVDASSGETKNFKGYVLVSR